MGTERRQPSKGEITIMQTSNLDFDKFVEDLKKVIENNLHGHDGIEISLYDLGGNPAYQVAIATPDDGFKFVFVPTQKLEDEMKESAGRLKGKAGIIRQNRLLN
jgi:hypothetical protein